MKQTIRKTLLFTAILTALVFTGALSAKAQHGYRITKRVTFKKGEVSTLLVGTIPNTLEAHEYVIRARKGQTLHIKLSSPRKDINFAVTDQEGNLIVQDDKLRVWTEELTESGDYKIIVTTSRKGAARYTLIIQLATDI